jgi:hypothetical protein
MVTEVRQRVTRALHDRRGLATDPVGAHRRMLLSVGNRLSRRQLPSSLASDPREAAAGHGYRCRARAARDRRGGGRRRAVLPAGTGWRRGGPAAPPVPPGFVRAVLRSARRASRRPTRSARRSHCLPLWTVAGSADARRDPRSAGRSGHPPGRPA